MAGLSVADLSKRDNWNLILIKIEGKIPFILTTGAETTVGHKDTKKHKIYVDAIKSISVPNIRSSFLQVGSSIVFTTIDGKKIKLTDIQKTKEFGSAGNTTAKEDAALEQLRSHIISIKKQTGLNEIPIHMNGKIFNVSDAESTPGTPKSDFHLLDKNNKEVVWISHKDGRTEKDFQQWGGISEKEEKVNHHKETQQFILECQSIFGDKIPNATTMSKKIKNKVLKCMAIYGVDYGSAFGRQNVNVCYQGSLSVVKFGSYYFIVTSAHEHWNGEVPSGGYDPVFMITYKGDRSQFGISGARLTISPSGCRKSTPMPSDK